MFGLVASLLVARLSGVKVTSNPPHRADPGIHLQPLKTSCTYNFLTKHCKLSSNNWLLDLGQNCFWLLFADNSLIQPDLEKCLIASCCSDLKQFASCKKFYKSKLQNGNHKVLINFNRNRDFVACFKISTGINLTYFITGTTAQFQ